MVLGYMYSITPRASKQIDAKNEIRVLRLFLCLLRGAAEDAWEVHLQPHTLSLIYY